MDSAPADRLAARTRGFAGALALVTPQSTTFVHDGCEAGADFEIGSISKPLTGMLYHLALARGEVTASTRLDELLPLGGSAAGSIVLADLATHRSGLPRVVGARVFRRSLDYVLHATNPYDESLEEVYAAARGVKLRRGRALYSNVGFQLLGQALATAAGASYPTLLAERIVEPLGIAPCYVPLAESDLLASAVTGHAGRRPATPWVGESIAPAGGVRASVEAMAGLASAVLAGTAPGMAAVDPVADFAGPAVRIGAGWMTTDRRAKGLLTWHNGGTGGFRSWLGLRRELGLGVVVLGATTRSVDPLGIALLDELAAG